jgi:hypothetical protein
MLPHPGDQFQIKVGKLVLRVTCLRRFGSGYNNHRVILDVSSESAVPVNASATMIRNDGARVEFVVLSCAPHPDGKTRMVVLETRNSTQS